MFRLTTDLGVSLEVLVGLGALGTQTVVLVAGAVDAVFLHCYVFQVNLIERWSDSRQLQRHLHFGFTASLLREWSQVHPGCRRDCIDELLPRMRLSSLLVLFRLLLGQRLLGGSCVRRTQDLLLVSSGHICAQIPAQTAVALATLLLLDLGLDMRRFVNSFS